MAGKKQTGKKAILHRLNRIEGQIKGLTKMVEEERDCMDVLTQVAAVKAAIENVGMLMLENYYKKCMSDVCSGPEVDKAGENMMIVIRKFIKSVD